VISMSMGDEGSATRAADYFFRIPAVNQNSKMFTNMIQLQAGLWERHGNYTAAYGAYQKIFHIRDSIALLNNQKAVDTLIVRYQAKHIAYENTVTRKRYLLIYALAVAASLFILFILLFFTWKNIFKKRRSQQDLALAKAAAEQSITKRSFFISNMGHEIRTPLNAITGFSSLLATEDNTPEERKEYLNIISVNSQQLLKLINDILDFSDLEEGRIALNIKEHDVIKICRDTVDSIASSVPPAVKLSFRTVIPSLSIMTDDVRLRQVLINLLMNSTKFTSVGFIKLKVKIDPENSELLVFSVTDSGRGIEPDKKHIIFERFEKLNQFSPGSGLGLSICHAIVSAFGGKIWLDETYTQGAKFKFTIPIVKPDTSKDS
jgi:signal transduction histidine kinase